MASEDRKSALANALGNPLARGDLDAALDAVRAVHQRDPGADDAKRVVEALELLMSQVWIGSTEADPRYATAVEGLERGDVAHALQLWDAIVRDKPHADLAERLATRARLILAAASGQALPIDGPIDGPIFEDLTRNAAPGELPLSAFETDDETAAVQAVVPPEAFREEPTMSLELGEYELLDDAPSDAAESTRMVHASQLPVEQSRKETTRVAGAGELPLEELRRQIQDENADQALDLLLDDIEEEASRPALDLDVEDELDDEEGAEGPTEVSSPDQPVAERLPRRTPSRSFGLPKGMQPPPEGSGPFPMESFTPPARADSSRPPPAAIPSKAELSRAPHAPVETGEVALPSAGQWEVHEPGERSAGGERVQVGAVDRSWTGIRVEDDPATFEPGVEGVDADSWDDPTEVGVGAEEREAEAMVSRGELGEALRLYQDLATRSSERRHWDRVAEIAKMLQERAGG